MKKTLARILFFLLPPALLLGAAELFLRSQPNSYAAKQAAVDRMAPRVETLILGASHTYMGINPACLKTTALNLAAVSQTLDVDVNILRSYLPLMPRLKTVVANFDNAIFFDAPLKDGSESFRCTYYNLYMRLQRIDTWPRKAFETADWMGASERMKQILFGNGFTTCDSLGWYPDYSYASREADALSDEMGRRRNDNHTCRNWEYPERNRSYIIELADLCRQNGISLIILQTPLSKVYQQYVPKRQAERLEQMADECRQLPGVTFRSYADDARFNDTDFYNTDHLSDKGAEKFSKILAEELGI